MTKLTQQEFDEMAEKFLATRDHGKNHRWFCTPRQLSASVLAELRDYLFADDTHTEAERMEYLRLKAKYEMS